jgi:hypothetical protein
VSVPERSGLENGRIYEITFDAIGNDGAACTGTVLDGVPHDQSQGSVPIDSGARYDSTVSTNQITLELGLESNE